MAATDTLTSRPSRTKGPLVWLDMDQQALDAAYDQSKYAPNREQVQARRDANSAVACAVLGEPLRLAYGATEIEKLDVYRSKAANAPVFVFIHGGNWQLGAAKDYAYPAEMFVAPARTTSCSTSPMSTKRAATSA